MPSGADPSHDSASRKDGLQGRRSAADRNSGSYAGIGQMSGGEELRTLSEFISVRRTVPVILRRSFVEDRQTGRLESADSTGKIL